MFDRMGFRNLLKNIIAALILLGVVWSVWWFFTRPVKKELPLPPAAKSAAGRIAVVIDDWGYNKAHCSWLAQTPWPVGVAILPHLPYAREVIACSVQAGHEPMLHLPLEPHSRREMFEEGYVLKADMTPAQIRQTVSKVLSEMKGVVGVNNHQGSKGSESEALMTTLIGELNKRKLFFVDSKTSSKTKGPVAAGKLGVRIGLRDVFLDNRNERKAIEKQFAEAALRARETGYALVIGHDRVLTLKIIAEQMKKLVGEGYQFIRISEYIRQNGISGIKEAR